MKRILMFAVLSSLLVTGCTQPDFRSLRVKEQSVGVYDITMYIHDANGRWGQIKINAHDRSIAFESKHEEAWHVPVKDIEFLMYFGDKSEGLLSVKFPDQEERGLAHMPYDQWDEIIAFVTSWRDRYRFRTADTDELMALLRERPRFVPLGADGSDGVQRNRKRTLSRASKWELIRNYEARLAKGDEPLENENVRKERLRHKKLTLLERDKIRILREKERSITGISMTEMTVRLAMSGDLQRVADSLQIWFMTGPERVALWAEKQRHEEEALR